MTRTTLMSLNLVTWQDNFNELPARAIGTRAALLLIIMTCWFGRGLADDLLPISSWTLKVHDAGQIVAEKQLDTSTDEGRRLIEAIETWRAKSEKWRADDHPHRPGVVLESENRKINFAGNAFVVLSVRDSKDKPWKQVMRFMTDGDRQLRDRLKEFAQASQ